MSLAHQIMPAKPADRVEHTPPVGVRWHEYADIFPWIEGEAYRALVDDIRKNGVLEPIVMLDGAILDGRNRYMAARELGIEYPVIEYDGNNPLGFVISHNLTRRHLTESQRAMVAAKLAKMQQGARTDLVHSANLPEVSQTQAAAMLNVSERLLRTAKAVQAQGAPELVKAVEAGKVTASAAAVIAKQDQDTQRRLVAEDKLKRAAADLKKAEAEANEAEKLPKAEPLTAEQKAEQLRVFGTQAQRAVTARVDEIIERIHEQPTPAEAVAAVPPALHHAIDITEIRAAATWLTAFADAWEREHPHGNETSQ